MYDLICFESMRTGSALWCSRSVYRAAVWYYDHLAGQKPIIMLTTDPKVGSITNSILLFLTPYIKFIHVDTRQYNEMAEVPEASPEYSLVLL